MANVNVLYIHQTRQNSIVWELPMTDNVHKYYLKAKNETFTLIFN